MVGGSFVGFGFGFFICGGFFLFFGFGGFLPLCLHHIKDPWEKCLCFSNMVKNATPVIQFEQKSQFVYFLITCIIILSKISTGMVLKYPLIINTLFSTNLKDSTILVTGKEIN